MSKALVLLSGGVDSSTLLYLVAQGKPPEDTVALTFDYGQKQGRELLQAEIIAKRAPIGKWIHAKRGFFTILKGDFIPGRNAFLLSSAVSFAVQNEAEAIYMGAVADDYDTFPDCRPEFFKDMDHAFTKAYGVRVFAPFATMYKRTVVSIGISLEVPFRLTYTCYRGGMKPCMECAACTAREDAFKVYGLNYYGKELNI